ncbi:amidohydrolase family protein [Novosphingobium sp. Gsoil 351]|uniref:amidohydrolase family protein n=1 Tax=Novosphingobium sp. Gsoil 351 TaxID=2675225 RepID=UPI001E41F5DB|nr:amidohydrolase family protein [Novosphingobium sp. Gsoil 351]
MTADIRAGGRVHIENRYQQQDKVRAFAADVVIDRAGLPTAMTRAGEAFAFQPIDEAFEVAGGRATWRNRIERGSADAAGRYYVPFGLTYGGGLARDGAAYELGLLASALLRAGESGLDLLPVGHAFARVVREESYSDHGETMLLRLVAIKGTSLDPIYLWLDERDRFFAGDGVIRRGWRGLETALTAAVAEADESAVEKSAAVVGLRRPPVPTLIRDVALFDARRAKILTHRSVLLRGGKIVRIAPSSRLAVAKGVTVIDGRGATLLPGLWDMHVHLRPRDPLRFLASGVTTVRDMGNITAAMVRLERRLRERRLPGPAIVKAGFIDAAGPAATYNGTLVSSEGEALAAVDAYADAGYSQIKLYNQVKPEWVPAIAIRAHARGMRLSGHVPFGATVQQMVASGYDEVQHLIYPLLSLAGQPAKTPLTFNAARAAQTIDPASARVAAFAHLLHRHQVALDFTLSVYEPLLLAQAGKPPPGSELLSAALPDAARRQMTGGALPTPPDLTLAQFQGTMAKVQALMRVLYERGVPLVAGTDTPALGGLTLPRELELMAAAGLPPAEVLRIATFGAARIMRRDATTGLIELGKDADLVLVDGDPIRNISDIRRVRYTFKSGTRYAPDELIRALD